ncbi:MAG: hypothetical protein IJC25_07925 [Clostridia bacterium]|nr:hypothetical protein [Clostridia bacterium]
MTGKERFTRILKHQPVDRIGLFEHFWSDTQKAWTAQGHLRPGESFEDHFGYDIQTCWPFKLVADLDFVPQIVAEDEDTVTTINGNGATLRGHKHHDTTPEHVDFRVKEREDWERLIKPFLIEVDERRINFEAYRRVKKAAADAGRFFMWSGVNVFECMHPVCGHENMLVGMALDPEWIADMAMTYARLTVELQKILFEREGYPDGIWYYEDMGFKERPFMSPTMYRELIQPAHKYTIDYAKAHGLPVVMHSCGFVEPLLPGMIEAGIDCLQVIEVKAGMDLLKLHRLYGDKIAFMGGIDVRALYSNDKATVDAELEAKIPFVKQGFNYVLHSDHSIPKTVDYETYCYFIKKGLELGTYETT